MSLLDTGPETLLLRPAVRETDPDGNQRWRSWREGDPEHEITGAQVQPVSTDTLNVHGERIGRTVKAIFRALPDGVSPDYAVIRWDDTDWLVDGSRTEYRRGRLTKHVSFTLIEVR